MKTKITVLSNQQDFSTCKCLPIKRTIFEEGVSADCLLTERWHDGMTCVVTAIEILNDDGTPL
jgi:hypothetical protein